MFSYTLYNPNNIIIDVDENYVVVPFGHRCTSALICKFASLRKVSLPFDWTIPLFPIKIQNIIDNNFKDFIPIDIHNNVFKNKYDIRLEHFNNDIDKGIEEYMRRIDRFKDIINDSKKIYFVYANEDYLYDQSYRTDDFNESIFQQMLDLELFIKNKYPDINYNILYFNFKQHNIPSSSNIINIVLNTTTIVEYFDPLLTEFFRTFCGEVLTNIFNTHLSLGYTEETFLN
jgi:hypothetical protein